MRYAALLLLVLVTGCAHYEYDLRQPVSLHVGTDDFISATIDPLRYDLITVDGRLVMEIHNPTAAVMELVAGQSYALDPQGQTRLIRGFAIAPRSYIKLIFPPPKPMVRQQGRWVTFGASTNIETAGGFHHGAGLGSGMEYDAGGAEPVENLDENYYWNWDTGPVKFHFVFTDRTKTFSNDLMIARVKM